MITPNYPKATIHEMKEYIRKSPKIKIEEIGGTTLKVCWPKGEGLFPSGLNDYMIEKIFNDTITPVERYL